MPIRTGVVGYGSSAKTFHIPFLLSLPSLFTLSAIVQRSPKASDSAAADFPGVAVHASLSSMLAADDQDSVELVIITSIPSTHFAMCEEALRAGKHVLCEKPFVASSAEASKLARLASECGRVLCVYQNRRFDADFMELQRLLREGKLGRVVEVESHFDRHRPEAPAAKSATWKTRNEPGNGAIYDLGVHLIDQLVTLLGVPGGVTGFIGNQREYPVGSAGGDAGGDSFTVLLHYPSKGILATAKAAVVSPETEQLRFWVRGEKGSFKKLGLDPQEAQLKAGKRPRTYVGPVGAAITDFGVESPCGVLTISNSSAGSVESSIHVPASPPQTYGEIYRQLAACIRDSEPNPVSAEEAAGVLRVIEAAQLSSSEGRTVTL